MEKSLGKSFDSFPLFANNDGLHFLSASIGGIIKWLNLGYVLISAYFVFGDSIFDY